MDKRPTTPQTIATRVGPLAFTHDFANGYPTDDTIQKLYDERDFQRACQAYLWALPAASFVAWQRGVGSLGVANGQLASFLSYESRQGILTANATTPYYMCFADLSSGPLVLEMPPAGVRGGIIDAWQCMIPGTSAAANYVLLAPGQAPPADTAGYVVRQSPTFNIMIGVRLTDTEPEKMQGGDAVTTAAVDGDRTRETGVGARDGYRAARLADLAKNRAGDIRLRHDGSREGTQSDGEGQRGPAAQHRGASDTRIHVTDSPSESRHIARYCDLRLADPAPVDDQVSTQIGCESP